MVRYGCYLSRSTFPSETRWSPTELKCGTIVWAIKTNRTLFYGIPFEVYSYHQPPIWGVCRRRTTRVQWWFDLLSAYTYTLKHGPGSANGNAGLMSRLPLPTADPSDLDVYMIGASGVMPARVGPVVGGRLRSARPGHSEDCVVGERSNHATPLSSAEAAEGEARVSSVDVRKTP